MKLKVLMVVCVTVVAVLATYTVTLTFLKKGNHGAMIIFVGAVAAVAAQAIVLLLNRRRQ